jgi:hypothetical protein
MIKPWVRVYYRLIARVLRTIDKEWNGTVTFGASRESKLMGPRARRPFRRRKSTIGLLMDERINQNHMFMNKNYRKHIALSGGRKTIRSHCLFRWITLFILRDFNWEHYHAHWFKKVRLLIGQETRNPYRFAYSWSIFIVIVKLLIEDVKDGSRAISWFRISFLWT